MNYRTLAALIVGSLIAVSGTAAFAADDQAIKDEQTVVGACMVTKFRNATPPVPQAKIDSCANTDTGAAAKCLGLPEEQYLGFAKFCMSQLSNAKCVSTKMKVPLISYADCGYEQDPAACYKGLGYTTDAIVKLSADCQTVAGT